MDLPQQARVLRCSCCRVFQAHQVKKSLKWTCKVCGEQQSFLRAYGEGSGADCRRHVQKLNLLQAQLSGTPHRPPEEPAHASRERNAGPGPAERLSAQEEPQPSRNRWWKYLERGSGELGPPGAMGFSSWSSSAVGKPDAPSGTGLPRTRRWSQSAVQPPHSPAGQDMGDSEVTSEMQKDLPMILIPQPQQTLLLSQGPTQALPQVPGQGNLAGCPVLDAPHTDQGWPGRLQAVAQGMGSKPRGRGQTLVLLLTGCATQGHISPARKVRGRSHQDWDAGESPWPGRAAPSQWVQFLPPPRNSAQMDTEPSTLLQRDPVPAGAAQAEQGTPQCSNRKTTGALQLPWATHTPRGPKRPFGVTPDQLWGTDPEAEGRPWVRGAPGSQLVRPQDLFNTGEDFDDVL